MYLLYLSTAIALSAGIGVFVAYDTGMESRDARRDSRIEVSHAQQQTLSRALRREYQINPDRFPSVPAGRFAILDRNLVTEAQFGGYLDMGASLYLISGDGTIHAVMIEGPTSPFGGNGDAETGVSGQPQYVMPLLEQYLGNDFHSGPVLDSGDTPSEIADRVQRVLDSLQLRGTSVDVRSVARLDLSDTSA